jgi:hypothetical protein
MAGPKMRISTKNTLAMGDQLNTSTWVPRVKDLAEFARLGLRFQVLPLSSIVAWADIMILEGDIPDNWLMDLATVKDGLTADSLLRQLPGESQFQLPLCLLLALVHRRWRAGQLTIGQVRGIGWDLHCESVLPKPDGQGDWGVCLEVEGEEFDEGWRTENSLRKSIDETLSVYSEFEQFIPAWA